MNKVIVLKEGDVEISDGYHTFDELYEHRHQLWITLCSHLPIELVWRSKLHSDGTGLEGWFLLGAGLEAGDQISYHLPDRLWSETDEIAATLERAPNFDGHTSADVLQRLAKL